MLWGRTTERAFCYALEQVELTKEDDAKNQGYRLKLSKLLAQAGQPEESAQILEELMLHAGLTSEIHLLALCQLADIQVCFLFDSLLIT